ncbi:EF-hand domain-containing protein [Streptomyces sp. NPDC058289]|uniref:EF-hand domain-containing protein n=1 Tax=Streptomyces sp. NPDC058289 TaxID=3346425 RepID=UPI0036EF8C8F
MVVLGFFLPRDRDRQTSGRGEGQRRDPPDRTADGGEAGLAEASFLSRGHRLAVGGGQPAEQLILFDWFDQDRDGQLSEGDLQATAKVFAQVARDEDHTNVAVIHAAFGQWWQLLLEHADTDGDGQVSRPEFVTAMQDSVTAPEHFESAVMAIADAVMNAADTNTDGVLSQDEYVAMYEVLGVSPERSVPAFGRLDLDGDGVISHHEYRTAIVDFYLSTDPNAPGNYLLGPIAA